MKNIVLAVAMFAAVSCCAGISRAQSPFGIGSHTKGDYWARNFAMGRPWHGQYYYLRFGQPTALVVPPNSSMQQHYSWGVSQNTMTPIYHQFGRSAQMSPGGMFHATPIWPSHTDQFGVYSVRAPW